MKKRIGALTFTCIISLWWNLSVFLTNGIDFENTVQNKFLYVVCAILAQGGISTEAAVQIRLYLLPIVFMAFACIAAVCLRRSLSRLEMTLYLLPALLAGIPTLACWIFITAQWFPVGAILDTTAYVGAVYALWFFICLALIFLPRRTQQSKKL